MYTIFQQALNFRYCSERCLMNIKQGDGDIEYLPIPCVVNLGLSNELFMKSIILDTKPNTIIKNHKLNEMFVLLPSDIQKEIKKKVNNKNFDVLLNDNGNIFYEMRYIHENIYISSKYNLDFVDKLNTVLFEIAKKTTNIGENIKIEI